MSTFRRIWTVWKRFGQLVGDLIARLLLTILYWTLLAPFALVMQLMKDPFHLRRQRGNSFWHPREVRKESLAAARQQF